MKRVQSINLELESEDTDYKCINSILKVKIKAVNTYNKIETKTYRFNLIEAESIFSLVKDIIERGEKDD